MCVTDSELKEVSHEFPCVPLWIFILVLTAGALDVAKFGAENRCDGS
jgi:hypothetical protein